MPGSAFAKYGRPDEDDCAKPGRSTIDANLCAELATWAASKPKIRALYVTEGCPGSGIDVAVELEDQRLPGVAALWSGADMCAELAAIGIEVTTARLSTWSFEGGPATLIYAKIRRPSTR
jgi:hypothetical protein